MKTLKIISESETSKIEILSPTEIRLLTSNASVIMGPQGPAGPTGATGPQGPAGTNGINGLNGAIGATGPTGETGPTGATGAIGPQGIQGIQGETGLQGPAGATGAQGEQGLQGIQGLTGPAGADGTNGTNGIDGATGPTGPQGSQGIAGTNGIDGINGTDGLDGPTGSTGPQGIQGIQGETGLTGATGPQGPIGETGPQGIQGIQGPAGLDGTDGVDGTNGINGARNNGFLNADFYIWQEIGAAGSVSKSHGSNGTYYFADQWRVYWGGTGTVTQTRVDNLTELFDSKYYLNVSGTGTGNVSIGQSIEDVSNYAGQTVTISFWAKAASPKTAEIALFQNFGTGGSLTTDVQTVIGTIGTTWQQYTQVIDVSSIIGKTVGSGSFVAPEIVFQGMTASDVVSIGNIKIERGSIATSFSTKTGDKITELLACERYFKRQYAAINTFAPFHIAGTGLTTTITDFYHVFNVPMRISPTFNHSGISSFKLDPGNYTLPTAATISFEDANFASGIIRLRSIVCVQYRFYQMKAGNLSTQMWMQWDARF